jgi:serine protease Do
LRLAAICASAGALAVAGLGAAAQAPRLLGPPVAADGTLSFADLVERVSPAVVSVMVEREVQGRQIPDELEDLLRFRFGFPPGGSGESPLRPGPQRLEAQGSGFFIYSAGHIVTNNHVIDGADPLTDLAVLKTDAPNSQAYVQFAEDVKLRVGDWVVAVGNPYGLSGTVTAGIVSAIGGEGRAGQFLDFIQVDAPINRGNSGGPTFDLKGRVVGVNTAIYSETGGSVGIGFAIPARVAKDTVAQLIKSGSVTRGWLGVSIQEVTTDIAAALGRKEARGALVTEVIDGTPAARAGFQSGDLVLALNNRDILDPRDLTRSISALPPGSKANVKVLRDGGERSLVVTLGQRTNEIGSRAEPRSSGGEDSLSSDFGLKVAELTPALRAQFGVEENVAGVIVTAVKSGSAAEEAGLRTGVVILQADGKSATSGAVLKKTIEDAKKAGKEAVLIRFQAGEAKQFGALPLR